MKLEVRVPISPGPSWYNKVRLIAASIREFVPDAIVRVTVTWDEVSAVHPEIEGVVWADMLPEDYLRWQHTRSPYLWTMMARYQPPFYGDHVLFLDADVICLSAFDELFAKDKICGVMAHVPPISIPDWRRLMQGFGVYNFAFDREYTGYGIMTGERFGPTYFNSGVVFGPKELFLRLHEPYFEAIDYLRANLNDTYWFDQLGLALGLAKAEVPIETLRLRYNFPNQHSFEERNPAELADCRFLHYLRTDTIDRDRDLMNKAAMEKLIARKDLTGSNEKFRSRVEQLLPRLT